jgi:hypothetical protein
MSPRSISVAASSSAALAFSDSRNAVARCPRLCRQTGKPVGGSICGVLHLFIRFGSHDSRARSFLAEYRNACVELDALPPDELRRRIRTAVEAELDRALWECAVEVEQVELASINDTVSKWPKYEAQ